MLPIKFVYYDEGAAEKVCLTILSRFQHHFTKESMCHVRAEYEDGFVMEPIFTENDIRDLLKKRVEE